MPSETVATDEVWLILSMNINRRDERYCCSEHHSAVMPFLCVTKFQASVRWMWEISQEQHHSQ